VSKLIYFDAFAEAAQVKKTPSISEWADEKRVISKGAEKGQWQTSRTPYLKEIMDCLSPDSDVSDICVVKPTQMGFTEVGINTSLYYADVAPTSVLLIMHTQGIAETTAKNRINPAIKKIPELAEKITPSKKAGDGGPDLAKVFPEGFLEIKWAQTPSSFASIPAAVVICDDINRWPTDVGDEGNPLDLARGRTETFSNYKFYSNSTPTVKEKSNIDKEFSQSDQRHYYMPCPECTPREIEKQCRENMVIFEWNKFVFETDEHGQLSDDVKFCCPHCGSLIDEVKKEWMMSEESGAKWIPHKPHIKKRGYRITGMYQPLGMGRDWTKIAERFLSANEASQKGDTTKLKTVINTIFAEEWEKELTKIDITIEAMLNRREEYNAMVPEGVYMLCAGVDTHETRFEVEVVGYGKNGETWGIEKTIINGDPALPETKKALDEYLLRKTFIHESGNDMKIYCSTIDFGGHRSKAVGEFTAKRYIKRVYAIKGATTIEAPIVNKIPSKTKYETKLFIIGPNAAKDDFFSRLILTDSGSNYCHFPMSYDKTYFEQMLVEKKDAEGRWINPSKQRNEALDCRIYADCAYALSGRDVDRLASPIFHTSSMDAKVKKRRIISRGR
jgi:phage terminase large subunit GpA-like protein